MTGSITGSLEYWKQGDQSAAADLDRRFRAELLAVVRRRRSPQLRSQIDSEAVVNRALDRFLTGVRAERFPNLASRREIAKVLVTLAKRALIGEVRAAGAGKRDTTREVALDDAGIQSLADPRQESPLKQCIDAEAWESRAQFWEWLADTVRDEHEKAMEILERSLDGLSNNDIATELGMGVRNVQKIKQRMLDRILRELNDDDDRTARCDNQTSRNQPA